MLLVDPENSWMEPLQRPHALGQGGFKGLPKVSQRTDCAMTHELPGPRPVRWVLDSEPK